jgi:hypothetical protein
MPIFKGIPPGQKIPFDFDKQHSSVMCAVCLAKFRAYMKDGGERPVPCEACKEKLKNKMYSGRYPDR